MNTPTPITAAHLALVRDMAAQGQYLSRSIEHYAQEIADSEARAVGPWRTQVEELRAALALGQQNCDDAYEDLRDERDAARAELATCKDTSESLLESLRAEVEDEKNLHAQTRTVVEELNTICTDLKNAGGPPFIRSEAIRFLREDQATLRAEVERLRSDRDCEKRLRKDAEELREDAIERAERAEAELATERARLDSGQIMLIVAGERVWHSGVDLRAAIDAGMREGAK